MNRCEFAKALSNAWKNHTQWCQEMRTLEKSLKHSLWFKLAMKYRLDHATVHRFMDWIDNVGTDTRKLSMEQIDLLYQAWDGVFRDNEFRRSNESS